MRKGGKFQTVAAMLALAGCNGESGKLTIRSMPAPVSSVAKPVPLRVAEARGHLALGNVALALESYRKAVREQPDNVEALTGVAGGWSSGDGGSLVSALADRGFLEFEEGPVPVVPLAELPRQGSTFVVELPASEAPAAAGQRREVA